MSLIKRPNSRYWYVQFQIENRTFVRSTKTTERKAALKVADKIRANVHQSIMLGETRTITFGGAVRRYVDSRVGTPYHASLISVEKSVLRVISGAMPLDAVTSSVIEEFVSRRTREGRKPQTIKHGVNCIVAAIKKARKDGFHSAPIDPPQVRVPAKQVRYLSFAEERRLLAELDPNRAANGLTTGPNRALVLQDNFDLIVMLLDTGARYGEIANIRWQQINLAERSIDLWRSKVNNQSVLFMTDRVAEISQRRKHSRKGEHVFTNRAGGPRGYSVVAIRKAFNRAGLTDCTVHTLRHTHATRLIQNGLSVYEVRSVLGHADIKTTLRYAHLEQAAITQKARDVINTLVDGMSG